MSANRDKKPVLVVPSPRRSIGTLVRRDPEPILDPSGTDLEQLVGFLFDHLDVADSTRSQYRREVGSFLNWIRMTGNRVDQTLLIRWKHHLQSRSDIGTGSKNKQLNLARVVLRELHRWYPNVFPDLTKGVKGFRVTRTHKRTPLSDEDIDRVWLYLESSRDLRTKAIIGLLYFQGLRRIEVTRLTVEDFDLRGDTLYVHGKGRDDKELIDLHPKTVRILDEYLRTNNLRSGWIFPSRKTSKGLSSNMIWRIVKRMHAELGITNNVHSYRKAFTSKLIDSGLNLLEVREYTRHRDTSQLQTYYDRLNKNRTLPTYYSAF